MVAVHNIETELGLDSHSVIDRDRLGFPRLLFDDPLYEKVETGFIAYAEALDVLKLAAFGPGDNAAYYAEYLMEVLPRTFIRGALPYGVYEQDGRCIIAREKNLPPRGLWKFTGLMANSIIGLNSEDFPADGTEFDGYAADTLNGLVKMARAGKAERITVDALHFPTFPFTSDKGTYQFAYRAEDVVK